MAGRRSVIVSAPSGAGKTTIVKRLIDQFPQLEFSISATSRAQRANEIDGRDYFFLSSEAFRQKVNAGEFVEWEEVYPGQYYGTLRAQLDAIWSRGHSPIFDVDVKGGSHLKQLFGGDALALFIAPPSLIALEERLRARGTETHESLRKRIGKAEEEMAWAPRFDAVIVNDHLDRACAEASARVTEFLRS
jgi:guanylate kinase